MGGMRRIRPIGLALAAAACTAAAPVSAGGASSGVAPCHSALQKGVLPIWARTGFSDKRPRMPHVLGRNDAIAAIEFGYPLLSPPSQVRANKILWVSRRPQKPLSNLWIHAQRMVGTRDVGPPATRLIRYGPGPSYVNLPAAGCWRLKLSWSGRTDTLDLQYYTHQ